MWYKITNREWHGLGLEPATIPLSFTSKASKQVIALDVDWQNYILALNGGNKKIFDKIADPHYGPSIGIKNGKLMLNVLAYALNYVNVLEIVGSKTNPIARIQSIGVNDAVPSIANVNKDNCPQIIHHVTYQLKMGVFAWTGNSIVDNVYVPLISKVANQLYIPMKYLTKL